MAGTILTPEEFARKPISAGGSTLVSPVPGIPCALAPVVSCKALSQSQISVWNTPELEDELAKGNACAYLCARVTSTLTPEEREHAEVLLSLSHFDDELGTNGVATPDLRDPENVGLTVILTKSKYHVADLQPEAAVPATVATLEYQRACQPGQVKIWDDERTVREAVHGDGSRSFRMTKTIIPFIISFTVQFRASQIPAHRLQDLAPLCDGCAPHKALLLERTKRDISKQDAIGVCKSILLYYWPIPGGACEIHHVVICATRKLPGPIARIIHSLGGLAAREVGETALRTRQWFAANPVSGVLAEAADWDGMDSPRSEIDDFQSLFSDNTSVMNRSSMNRPPPFTPSNSEARLLAYQGNTLHSPRPLQDRIEQVKELVTEPRISAGTTVVLLGAAAVTGPAMPIVAVGCVGGALLFSGITGAAIARTGFGGQEDEWREQSLRITRDGTRLQDYTTGERVASIRWQEDSGLGDEEHVYGELTVTLSRRVPLRVSRGKLYDLSQLAGNLVEHNLHSLPAPRTLSRDGNREARCSLCCCQ